MGWNIIELNQTDLTAYIRHRHLPIYTYVQDWIIPLPCTLDRSCGILNADFSCLILDTDCQPRELKRRLKEKNIPRVYRTTRQAHSLTYRWIRIAPAKLTAAILQC